MAVMWRSARQDQRQHEACLERQQVDRVKQHSARFSQLRNSRKAPDKRPQETPRFTLEPFTPASVSPNLLMGLLVRPHLMVRQEGGSYFRIFCFLFFRA